MDTSTRYVRAPGTVWRSIDQRAHLFRRGWEEILVLEGLGVWIWDCLAEPVSADELAGDAEAVLEEVVSASVERLVFDLASAGAVREVPQPSRGNPGRTEA